eukprot:SAG25_NODE_3919_length_929_cov_1.322892_1_plen_101_part_00
MISWLERLGGERGVLLAPFVAAAAPDLRSRILSATEICQDQIADPWNKLKLLKVSHYNAVAFPSPKSYGILERPPHMEFWKDRRIEDCTVDRRTSHEYLT